MSSPPWMRQDLPCSFLQASLWGPCAFQSQRNDLRLGFFVQLQAGAARLKVRTSMPLLLIRFQNVLVGNQEILFLIYFLKKPLCKHFKTE